MHSFCFAILRRGSVFALLALIPAFTSAKAPYPAWQWITHYYEDPDPAQFIPSLFELSRNGFFDMPGHVPLGIGFIATLFRQNPDEVDAWLLYCRALPEQERRLLFSALWYSGHPKGAEYLQYYAEVLLDGEMAQQLSGILESRPSLDDRIVHNTSSLYAQWGVFLATGEAAPLNAIFLGLSTTPDISMNDRWWLARSAAEHERVIEICRREMERKPAEIQDIMGLVIYAQENVTSS